VTYDPKAIANFFIAAAANEGKRLTPLQVIKLVYIAHGWHLGLTGEPLINEPPQAWQYGPVVPSLYHSLKIYGNSEVTEPLRSFSHFSRSSWPIDLSTTVVAPPDDPSKTRFLESVWKAYKKFSGSQLSTMTHQPGTPWQKTWDEKGAKYTKGVQIPDEMIREHYEQLRASRTTK